MKRKTNATKRIAEASILVAFATVLSMLKLVDMPYGGSVTAASMLPIIIVSYRHGSLIGLASGLVFATLQQLLGLNTLSYVTGWQSIVAVIMMDYILAFTLVGLGGAFKGKLKNFARGEAERQSLELAIGAVLVCVLRYVLHTIAGATVWAGLSIPTEAALIYSIGYNATYMIPETIVTTLAAGWLGSVLDLSRNVPQRFAPNKAEATNNTAACEILTRIGAFIIVVTVVTLTILSAPCLQNAESGEFDFSGLSSAPWTAICVVAAAGAVLSIASFVTAIVIRNKSKGNSKVQ